jgi:oxygen-independent coproporphyrinogen-3 oxidase
MWSYRPELLATPVPRYTSYPTAAEFHGGVGASDMAAALDAVEPGAEISLYLHIPYCHEICWYCGCNTGAANKAQRLTAYLEALHAEIALVAERLGGRATVSRLSFGGGSPNAVAPEDFLRLIDTVASNFPTASPEISVEIDPRSFSGAWARAMAAAGVTRASLGVQTFAPHVQRAIGRVQPLDLVRKAVDQLRTAGVASINFDLMYGLPHQSMEDLQETLAETVAVAPERIALFGYAHVPHLIPRQRRIDASSLPDAEVRFEQARLGHEILTSAAYRSIGFDHFALPQDAIATARQAGALRRNFQGFTEDGSEVLIGLGASAISSFPGAILQNEKNAGRYRMLVSSGRLPAARGVLRSHHDQLRARIIEGLLCSGEADISALCLGAVLERLRPFRDAGLLTLSGSSVRLAPDALPYARVIAAAFDEYRQPGIRRFSNAI